MSKKTIIVLIVVLLLLIGGGAYYWFIYKTPDPQSTELTPENVQGFSPLNPNGFNPPSSNNSGTTTSSGNIDVTVTEKAPTLRLLSSSPVAGVAASTTRTGVAVRFIDRAVGHIFETSDTSLVTEKISNTTLSHVYESFWNRNASVFVLRYIKPNTDTVVNFYGEILRNKVSTSTAPQNTSTFQVKGKFLSSTIEEIAFSPKKDQMFTFEIQGGKGYGYTSGLDESKKTKIFDTPVTRVNIEWPTDSVLTMTTKASGVSSGFMYSVDAKSGSMKKIIGNITGLSGKMSKDGKNVLFSSLAGGQVRTSLYNLKDGTSKAVIFNTLADKCVWSTLNVTDIYCAVPSEFPPALYPDDWYKGKVTLIDQIWHLDTSTGEVHLLANLLQLSDKLIDATNLTLDPKENFLYFINKNDLSLWSLDLN